MVKIIYFLIDKIILSNTYSMLVPMYLCTSYLPALSNMCLCISFIPTDVSKYYNIGLWILFFHRQLKEVFRSELCSKEQKSLKVNIIIYKLKYIKFIMNPLTVLQ